MLYMYNIFFAHFVPGIRDVIYNTYYQVCISIAYITGQNLQIS